jgi:hypothetical protein
MCGVGEGELEVVGLWRQADGATARDEEENAKDREVDSSKEDWRELGGEAQSGESPGKDFTILFC